MALRNWCTLGHCLLNLICLCTFGSCCYQMLTAWVIKNGNNTKTNQQTKNSTLLSSAVSCLVYAHRKKKCEFHVQVWRSPPGFYHAWFKTMYQTLQYLEFFRITLNAKKNLIQNRRFKHILKEMKLASLSVSKMWRFSFTERREGISNLNIYFIGLKSTLRLCLASLPNKGIRGSKKGNPLALGGKWLLVNKDDIICLVFMLSALKH